MCLIPIRSRLPFIALLACGFTAGVAARSAAADDPAAPAELASTLDRWLEKPILPEKEAEGMLADFIEKNLQPIPLPTSEQEWLSTRTALRQRILSIVGLDDLVPPRWDLKLTRKGTIVRDGYRIEKLTYETYPGKAIAALLYVPAGLDGPAPGVVSISGHTSISKAADYVQRRNVNLALRGCVVLSYDYFGYGESKTGDNPSRPTGNNGHHLRQFSFSRRTATALEILDAIRAIDVLTSRTEVDPTRIGFTGESGGGNSTYWIAALDERVKLVCPVSSVTTFDYWIRTDVNWDWHQRPPGIRRVADIGVLLALHAPRPLTIISSLHGTDDEEFPIAEAEKSYRWAREAYRLCGAEDAIRHVESTTPHGYQDDKQRTLFADVERWLEPPNPRGDVVLVATIESVDDLRCGLPADNLTCHDVFQQWTDPLPEVRNPMPAEESRQFLRDTLGWPAELPDIQGHLESSEKRDAWTADFWLIESEPGIRLPAVHVHGESPTTEITLIPGDDREAILRALANGNQVLAFDPRGTGETTMPKNFRNWSWFAGRPIVGQWAHDIAQAARFSRDRLGAKTATIEARPTFGLAALLAGGAEAELFDAGRLSMPLASFREQLASAGAQALAEAPGLMQRLDIPQIQSLWKTVQIDKSPQPAAAPQ